MAVSDYIINYTDPLKGSFIVKPYTSNGNRFPTTSVRNASAATANSPLLVFGKGHPEYGERTDENIFHLAESFSGPSAPIIDSSGNTVSGLLWHAVKSYYREAGGDIYAYSGSWNLTTKAAADNLLANRPASANNMEVFYATDTLQLFVYSTDERNIDGWLELIFATGAGAPAGLPESEMRVNHDGTSTGWAVVPDSSTLDITYLRLDGGNNPTADIDFGGFDLTNADQIRTSIGGVGAPSYSYVGDVTTGVYSPGAGRIAFTNAGTKTVEFESNGTISVSTAFYETLVLSDNDIPNKRYVDLAAAGAAGADTFVSSGSFFLRNLSLNYNGSPQLSFNVDGLTANIVGFPLTGSPQTNTIDLGGTSVTHVQQALLTLDAQKAELTGNNTYTGTNDFTGSVISGPNPTVGPHLATKTYVDAQVSGVSDPNPRDIQVPTGSPLATTFTLPFSYVSGFNRLQVYNNGVKQYKNVSGFDEALFNTAISSTTPIVGLPTYTIIGVGASSFIIAGNHVSEFTIGDSFRVDGNTGLGGTPTTYSINGAPTFGGSPEGTDIPVAALGGADGTGTLGIDYDFNVDFDAGGATQYFVNGLDISDFSELITEMDTAFAGAGETYISGGDLRVQTTTAGVTGSVVLSIGSGNITADLFGPLNLGTDGLTFGGSPVAAQFRNGGVAVVGTDYAYSEPGAHGTLSTSITFNAALLPSDVLEFVLIQ